MEAEEGYHVFVGNLPFDASLEEVSALLQQCGTVTAVRLVTNANTGRSKGFGFAVFAEPEAVKRAADTELTLRGRRLRVEGK